MEQYMIADPDEWISAAELEKRTPTKRILTFPFSPC